MATRWDLTSTGRTSTDGTKNTKPPLSWTRLPQGSRRSAGLVPTENFCSNPWPDWPDQRYDWGMTIYQASSGAWVFNTATVEWAGASTITSRESKRTDNGPAIRTQCGYPWFPS